MKIDKDNPMHWVYAGAFALTLAIVVVVRLVTQRSGKPLVLLYGHKLNGNLRALYDGLAAEESFDFAYLTMDAPYHRSLRSSGERTVLGFTWQGLRMLSRARCVVTDHGPQLMAWLPLLTDLIFVDVWHGIPFKGWSVEDFRALRRYDEMWVTSDLLKRVYIDRFAFHPSQIRTTGYGRTDVLINQPDARETVRSRLGLEGERVLLFAPTWSHGAERSEIPFGLESEEFFSLLEGVARRHDAICVVRAHLNTRLEITEGRALRFMSHQSFPDAEALLQAADVLVCDWSSIAFDFLLLDRPTVFLDVPAPFAHGFTLDSSYRFGALAAEADQLESLLDDYLDDPGRYLAEVGERPEDVKQAVYGGMADGRATERYVAALHELLDA